MAKAKKNNDLLSQLLSTSVVNSVASNTGSSKKDVTSVLASALPSLLSGALAQNNSTQTSSGFLSALTSHGQKEESTLLDKLDLTDGGKIVAHLLGANTNQQVENTAKETGVSSDLVSKIISAAAPVLMAYLGKQVLASISTNTAQTKPASKPKPSNKPKPQAAANTDLLSSAASSILSNIDVGSILTNLLK